MSRFPLHVQILIALVLGTIIGLIANPGAIELSDTNQEITFNAVQGDDGSITATFTDPTGTETLVQRLAEGQTIQSAFPGIGPVAIESIPENGIQKTIQVSERSLRIVEDGLKITINYTRKHNERSVVSRESWATAAELKRKSVWADQYAEHGGGFRAKITTLAKFIGDMFLRLLKMVTVPLIATSLITGVAGLGETSRLRSMFTKTLGYYIITSLLAITTGILMVNIISPGVGAELPGAGGSEVVTYGAKQSIGTVFDSLFKQMVPTNPFAAFAGAEFLSIITFSILIGIFIIRTGGESGETLRKFFKSAFEVIMKLTMAVIALAPIGVLAFMVFATASQGLEIFATLAKYMLTVFLALVIHGCIVLPLILKFVAGRSPIEFFRAMSPALMTAFSTASSNATLPLTMTSVEQRAGVPNRVSSFVLPLGATINMDGTALYEAVAVLFIAQATPGFEITLQSQILVALTALLASIGAAGIPHAGLVMMAIVLQAVGLPLEAQGIIIAVDRVLDMCRTSINVWSDSCGCAVVSRFDTDDAAATPEPA